MLRWLRRSTRPRVLLSRGGGTRPGAALTSERVEQGRVERSLLAVGSRRHASASFPGHGVQSGVQTERNRAQLRTTQAALRSRMGLQAARSFRLGAGRSQGQVSDARWTLFAARVRPGRAVRSAARGRGQSICRRVLVSGLNSRWPPDPGQRLVALSARLPTRVRRESRSSAGGDRGVGHAQGDGTTNEILTLDEAAGRARLSTRTLRRAVRSGRLRASQPSGRGGKLLVATRDLERWLFAGLPETTVPALPSRSSRRLTEPLGTPARISLADLRGEARP